MRKTRALNECRKVKITKNYIIHPAGSVLIQMGNTKVICSTTVEEKVPSFLRGKGSGWVTAEYSMLPSSTNHRTQREASRGKLSGRTQEIQRLIGRSLRSVTNLEKLGERQIKIDCDVIQADGGTRTASITGGYIALYDAVNRAMADGLITSNPIKAKIASISVGIYQGEVLLDLNYKEDSAADTDMNVVMDENFSFIEIQGTSEKRPFTNQELNGMLDLARKGISKLFEYQEKVIG